MLPTDRHASYNANNEIECNRINVGEDDEYVLEGYTASVIGLIGLVILIVLTGGILLILILGRPSLKVRISKQRCPLEQAQLLILKDKHGEEFVEKVQFTQRDKSFCFVYFYHKKLKYVWRNEYKHFTRLKGLESERCSVIYSQAEGATSSEALIKSNLYGKNSIEIELLPIWKLILDEITGPFYLYQFFICSIWLVQLYYQFATCILFLSIVSVATHVWQTRKQTIELKRKVQSASSVTVIRDEQPIEICSSELVPGDVINLPIHSQPFLMECDAILITGSCIVDESMLTGESVPVPKVTLVEDTNSIYSPSVHKSNTIFSGTRVLNVKSNNQNNAKAIVVRTGFSTAKGELARSILFPSKSNNNLNNQLMKISAIFFVIGIPCMIYTIYALGRFDFPLKDICINVLDVATFLIPPVLPAVLTSLNVHGQRRLKTKGIYCLNPRMISCSGEIDVMCFDKTGTLTEDSIDFAGIVFSENQTFQNSKSVDNCHIISKSMATCHSLVKYCGNIEGDDLDQKLFMASKWQFVENTNIDQMEMFGIIPERIVSNGSNQMVGIIKQFPFESFLQRMLVITKEANRDKFVAIVKGSPEMVASLCTLDSIPTDFVETFESYTRKGFRVLATASKELDVDCPTCFSMGRSELESNMTFHGLYLFKNKLKDATSDVIQELLNANIRCVMATGDNLLTGISVAEECNLIKKSDAIIKVRAFVDKANNLRVYYSYSKYPDIKLTNNNSNFEHFDFFDNVNFNYHLAIDGDSYNAIKSCDLDLLNKIVHKGTIFARMSADQKLSLINLLQKQDHRVGMCGDGANDCGALRAADSGVSLSVAEASVASPFTYKRKDISCVPSLIKEGRCTLVAAFGAFKYQVCYCFILLGAVLILFWDGTKPSDGNYVFIDIILNILPPILFGTTEPFKRLVKMLPPRNILSFVPQFSMYSFILIQVSLYYYVYTLLLRQSWYMPVDVNEANIGDPRPNHLAYAIFSVNMMSYVIAAIIFAPGPPYRNEFWSNKTYILVVVINFLISGCVSIIAPKFLLDFLRFQEMPYEFRLNLLLISLANFAVCFIWERFVIGDLIQKKIVPQLRAKMKIKSGKKFNAIGEQVVQDNWPFHNIVSSSGEKKLSIVDKPIDLKMFNRVHSEANLC